MNFAPAIVSIALCLLLAACDRFEKNVVIETRPPATRDVAPRLNATSDERFRDAKPSPVVAETPVGWLALPATQFRLLNYRFGESGMGEVWVSLSSGSLLENVNRWLKQFNAAELSSANLAKLPIISLAGHDGRWVEAKGEYASGMGAEPQPGYALAGVVAAWEGKILTVKMVGPIAEVEKAIPTLRDFIGTVRHNP